MGDFTELVSHKNMVIFVTTIFMVILFIEYGAPSMALRPSKEVSKLLCLKEKGRVYIVEVPRIFFKAYKHYELFRFRGIRCSRIYINGLYVRVKGKVFKLEPENFLI